MNRYIPESYLIEKINCIPFLYREVLYKIIREAPAVELREDSEFVGDIHAQMEII